MIIGWGGGDPKGDVSVPRQITGIWYNEQRRFTDEAYWDLKRYLAPIGFNRFVMRSTVPDSVVWC